ncbi:MAG: hypothetical protein Q8J89_14515 [Caulobacter sp.]|nr:hypothetical protein [Caulobacter sp.]
MARLVVPGAPHHLAQRGNRRQVTFFGEGDYLSWQTLTAEAFAAARAAVWAYCLTPDPLHVSAAPYAAFFGKGRRGQSFDLMEVSVPAEPGWSRTALRAAAARRAAGPSLSNPDRPAIVSP